MCGIAGCLSLTGKEDERAVDRVSAMLQAMVHRGPDQFGLVRRPGAVLGHRRLSIIDLSEAARQPFISPDGQVVLIYNGEFYGFRRWRERLEVIGYRFRSASDTEVVLTMYLEYGDGFLQRLDGMFALALWDGRSQKLLLGRDRLGVKPLAYRQTSNELVFASEIQALVQDPACPREVVPEQLCFYLQHQYTPSPGSMFAGVKKLPPAHVLTVTGGRITLNRYWDYSHKPKRSLSDAQAIEEVSELLHQAVQDRLVSDVPIGALLSGGIDSGVIVALMSQHSVTPVRTFSMGFRQERFNELPLARLVAERYATVHQERILNPDILNLIQRHVKAYGEPFADKSSIPTLAITATAREHVTVALSGDGGDEVFGGYPKYLVPALSRTFSQVPETLRRQVRLTLARVIDRLDFHSLPARFYRACFYPERRVLPTSFAHSELRQLLRPEWQKYRSVLDSEFERLLQDGAQAASDLVERLMWLDTHTYLPDDLLVKMDIASMACSLEVRSPYLDYRLVERVATLPARLKAAQGRTKRLLRLVAEPLLPRDTLTQPKRGFGFPVAEWLRGPLANITQRVLVTDPVGIAEYCRAEKVAWLVAAHASGRGNYGNQLWTLLNFALWYRHFIAREENGIS